jgi:hypothetical protein
MLSIAFKEWAVVCQALATGRQALILRKGGISEVGGEFQPEHSRFWLYQTYLHEHKDGIKPASLQLLEQALHDRAPNGMLRLTHFAEVTGIHHVAREDVVLGLDEFHIWSESAVKTKFHYRHPGAFVLSVRIYRAAKSMEILEMPDYAGCRTWVKLAEPLSTDGAVPVLDEQEYAANTERLKKSMGMPA